MADFNVAYKITGINEGAASDGGDIGAVAVWVPVTTHTAPRRGFGFWRKGFNL